MGESPALSISIEEREGKRKRKRRTDSKDQTSVALFRDVETLRRVVDARRPQKRHTVCLCQEHCGSLIPSSLDALPEISLIEGGEETDGQISSKEFHPSLVSFHRSSLFSSLSVSSKKHTATHTRHALTHTHTCPLFLSVLCLVCRFRERHSSMCGRRQSEEEISRLTNSRRVRRLVTQT